MEGNFNTEGTEDHRVTGGRVIKGASFVDLVPQVQPSVIMPQSTEGSDSENLPEE